MTAIADEWGVERRYQRSSGAWQEVSDLAVERVLEAMEADGQPKDTGPLVLTAGQTHAGLGEWSIYTELGDRVEGVGALPADLPNGYHWLSSENQEDRRLIVAPAACPSLENIRWWGWTAQLYALRSRKSWGIGDLGDLDEFSKMANEDGAGFGIVNPLHAPLPDLPQESSPYYPSSREFRSLLYLRIEDVPGAETFAGLEAAINAGRALNSDRRIDRDQVWTLKSNALRSIWAQRDETTPGVLDYEFENYIETEGESLRRFAIYGALSERHGRPWQRWPAEFRRPDNPEVIEFAEQHADSVRFHQWVQWLIHRQLGAASAHMPIVQDLAVGVNPAGADAWQWQDVLALGVRVGAPPDRFNTRGQDWGIPPFDPWKLRAANYDPFIGTVRSALAFGGGIRIDHVMGLFRLFWIPEDLTAADGTYVRYPWADMLSIVALESSRKGGIVCGEDLGTVEPFMRVELERRNVLSYKLLWFQHELPETYPVNSLAAVTTHDLPTIDGLLTGRDLEIQQELGTHPNTEAVAEMTDRVATWLEADASTPPDVSVARAHALLAKAPSSVVSATVEDALCLAERPNYPGTTDEWPNWSVALPVDLEDLRSAPGYQKTVDAFISERGPGPKGVS